MLKNISKLKMLLMDIDGVMTDGSITYFGDTEVKTFSAYDGLGIKLAQKNGLICGVISGRSSKANEKRMSELKIKIIYQSFDDKIDAYEEIKKKFKLKDEQIAYIGDDLNDLPVLKKAGVSFTVKNAVNEVKNNVDYISRKEGGKGAVREIIEFIFK